MNQARAKYLKEYCHDAAIELKASVKCGKLIPSISDVQRTFEVLEEVLKHIEQDMGSR